MKERGKVNSDEQRERGIEKKVAMKK